MDIQVFACIVLPLVLCIVVIRHFSTESLIKEVDSCVDGVWKCVGHVENNIQRLAVVDFTPEMASAVRIHALRATGMDRAIIPEVRIYE